MSGPLSFSHTAGRNLEKLLKTSTMTVRQKDVSYEGTQQITEAKRRSKAKKLDVSVPSAPGASVSSPLVVHLLDLVICIHGVFEKRKQLEGRAAPSL